MPLFFVLACLLNPETDSLHVMYEVQMTITVACVCVIGVNHTIEFNRDIQNPVSAL